MRWHWQASCVVCAVVVVLLFVSLAAGAMSLGEHGERPGVTNIFRQPFEANPGFALGPKSGKLREGLFLRSFKSLEGPDATYRLLMMATSQVVWGLPCRQSDTPRDSSLLTGTKTWKEGAKASAWLGLRLVHTGPLCARAGFWTRRQVWTSQAWLSNSAELLVESVHDSPPVVGRLDPELLL